MKLYPKSLPNLTLTALAVLGLSAPVLQAADLAPALSTQMQSDKAAAASQKKIDNMADETSQALQKYRAALQRAESLKVYNAQLEKLIASQQEEKVSMTTQIEKIDTTETGVLPLMVRMTDTLSELVDKDAPFLPEERSKRVQELKTLIDRADVSVGEKFRRIMEAYTVEADYGRTIEAYRGELAEGDQERMVDFLRIGRVGLYYQTLDGSESGRWNSQSKSWEPVGTEYRRAIRDGLRIARKQAPPSMLTLPVENPESQS